MEKRIDTVNGISALPESVIHHIMSFLSFKEAVQSSTFCKTWNEAWYTFPTLGFNDIYDSSHSITKEKLKYMENILLRRHMELISIKKVIFNVHLFGPEVDRLVDGCLCHAFGSNVKELNLQIFPERFYNVPQIVYAAQSLNVLELNACRLCRPRISVKLFLRKLCLCRVSADDHTIQNLIAGCPLVEHLSIEYSRGFQNLELLNLSKLDYIKLRDNHNLCRLNIKELNVRSVFLQLIMIEINIASCKNVKCLKLSRLPMINDLLCNGISELLLLEDLTISHCVMRRPIKISFPCLKALCIERCLSVGVKIETPNLSIFEYRGDIMSFSSTTLDLSRTDLYIYESKIADAKYIEFLAKFPRFTQVLDLGITECSTIAIIPRELRQILHPPLSSVKHLISCASTDFKEFSITKLVDGLLWLSPHVETASVKCRYNRWGRFSFQFTYKKKLNYEGETFHCCRSLPVLCWQNCIEKVKIEYMTHGKYDVRVLDVKSYSFQGEKILEKIDDLCTEMVEQNLL